MLLARTKLQSFDRSELNTLIQASAEPTKELLQSHYTVSGSCEDLVCAVSCAFNKWRACKDEYSDYAQIWNLEDPWASPYRWSCILATYHDHICFYTDAYDAGPCYFTVSYDVVDGKIHIGTDIKSVEASIVIKGLGSDSLMGQSDNSMLLAENLYQAKWTAKKRKDLAEADFGDPKNRLFPISDQDDVDSAAHLIGKAHNPSAVKARIISIAKRKGLSLPDAWTTKKQDETMAETTIKQDAVTEVEVDNAASDTPAQHSDDNLKIKGAGKPTDANSDGAASTASGNPAASTPVEHSDSNPAKAGNMNTPGTGIIDNALADTAPGTKQSVPHTNEFLLQASHRDSAGQSLSYMKLQSVETTTDGKKKMNIQGIVTRADIVNTEGEVYPLSVWDANLPKMNELATQGKFIGKLEHPDKELGLQDAAILYTKFWMQGSDVWANAVVIPTFPDGQNLQAIIESGVSVDFSSRGYGTMKQQDYRGTLRKVVQDDYSCVAFDAVWHGASTGSGVTQISYQSATNTNASEVTQSEKDKIMPELTEAQKDAQRVQSAEQLKNYRKGLLAEANLAEQGQKVYNRALRACTTIEAMHACKQSALPAFEASFGKAEALAQNASKTYSPTFIMKQSQEEKAPKSVGEMFDRMVQGADLPERYPGVDPSATLSKFNSPRLACRELLGRVAQSSDRGFHGLSAARALLALEQGKIDHASNMITQSNLYQSFASDSTIANGNANNDGAPLSAPLIFPLIRRVFPHYIMNEVCSIQPMDRPQGKIFYLDAYRTEDPAGNEKRIDLNTSANPFNSSYADNNTEGSTAELVRLRLTSLTVSAYTKKIGAQWSIEEMQDLRAYHGLDAAQELMGSTAREMALEWNKTVLDDMLAQATAGAFTFGTAAPSSGFPNQKDWDEYIWRYVMKLDNAIFSKRNGPMTHIVCGVDAALALNAAFRGVLTLGNEGDNSMEMYPGTTFYGAMKSPTGGIYRIFKTNFWTTGTANGSKILGLRRGTEWSDTPYIWAPYTDYVTPQLVDPADFSQRQGIMSRAAKQVVVSDAMGTINVASGVQGAVVY